MALFGLKVFADTIKDLEMTLSWIRIGSKSNDVCPYKRQKRDTHGHSKKVRTEGEIGVRYVYKPRNAKNCQSHQKLGKSHGTDSSSEPLEGASSVRTSGFQNHERTNCTILSQATRYGIIS